MIESLDKVSFNENDLLKYPHIVIEGSRKRVNWTWNIEKFLKELDYKEFDKYDS